MRVIAGIHGGRTLVAPRGRATRPTADRVREALFASLGALEGLHVLDLFAGSGALGIEALSRGAAGATFVDSATAAIAAVRTNLARLGLADAGHVDVRRQDAIRFLAGARGCARHYDLALVDPPYRLAERLGAQLSELLPTVLTASARIVCESDRRRPLALTLALLDERRYGDTLIRIHAAR